MKATWILILVAACAFPAVAQQVVTADWVDGTVERMVGSSWKAVDIGDSFGTDATLRLAKNASAELSSGGLRVHLTAPGTYNLSDAFQRAGGRVVTAEAVAKVMKLAGRGEYDVSTATSAGVRGDVQGNPGAVVWAVEEEVPEPYSQVRELYQAGRYQEASKAARNLRLSDAPSAAFRSAYWEAASFFAQGLALPAIKTLDETAPDPKAPEYRDANLLASQLWMELAEWDKAISRLKLFAPAESPVEDRQLALLLSSVCYDSLGQKKDARNALEAARSLAPDSDLGREAGSRLGK